MMNEEQFLNRVTYSDISRAISRDFSRLFLVNADTDVYAEYIPHAQVESLDIRTIGRDFQKVLLSLEDSVFSPDLDTFRTAVTRENILHVLDEDDYFSLTYRVRTEDKPEYVRLKVTRLNREDPSHILFAIGNTDSHIQRMTIYERVMSKQVTFTAISEALSSDYDCILYINTQSGEYVEYSSSESYKRLHFDPAGSDFFEACRDQFSRLVYEEDRDLFLRALEKENLLRVLSMDRLFLLTFRVILDSRPVHVRVKITKMNQADDHHIVLGLSNVEASMQRIQKYEHMREIANRDPLTGVRSKHAYSEEEERLNREIAQGTAPAFAVVVLDVNGLKRINDSQGHKAGDEYLRRSCQMISDIFAHSPVFRIGGDEFAVLLKDRDYESRSSLMLELHSLSAAHIGSDQGVVSGGLSEYQKDRDSCVADLFERADAAMYREKMLLKSLGASVREDEGGQGAASGEEIPLINLRRHILIADDQDTNREILGSLLSTEYDILFASDGEETMQMLREHKDEIALLILDLYMPKMTGREVMTQMQVDPELMSIPVIMLTVDSDAELDSLKIGAADFISKPYPDIDIVKARIAKCIELSENRDLIRHTRRDKLTGLLHFDYFLQYAERFDHQHHEEAFDALVADIKKFHSVNEQYGRQFGDLVLRSIGSQFRRLARKTGGIGCRQEGDTFLLYCPHRDDYEQLISWFLSGLFVEEETREKIHLRFGVFLHANREADIEKRFSLARTAASLTDTDPEKICGFFDLGAS